LKILETKNINKIKKEVSTPKHLVDFVADLFEKVLANAG